MELKVGLLLLLVFVVFPAGIPAAEEDDDDEGARTFTNGHGGYQFYHAHQQLEKSFKKKDSVSRKAVTSAPLVHKEVSANQSVTIKDDVINENEVIPVKMNATKFHHRRNFLVRHSASTTTTTTSTTTTTTTAGYENVKSTDNLIKSESNPVKVLKRPFLFRRNSNIYKNSTRKFIRNSTHPTTPKKPSINQESKIKRNINPNTKVIIHRKLNIIRNESKPSRKIVKNNRRSFMKPTTTTKTPRIKVANLKRELYSRKPNEMVMKFRNLGSTTTTDVPKGIMQLIRMRRQHNI